MKRYPDGWAGRPFFRRNAANYVPPWVKRADARVMSEQGERTIEVPAVNDELALLWMVNTGCIECHTWYSRMDRLDRPDWVVFDLDPSDDVGFPETVEVARLVKQALDSFGLVSFPKTSGAHGLHVLVPVERRHTYDDTRRVRRRHRAADRRHAPGDRDDRVVEGKAARRVDRRAAEREGQVDCVGLFGAADAGSAGLDAASLERGEPEARSFGLQQGRRAPPREPPRRPLRGRPEDEAVPEGRDRRVARPRPSRFGYAGGVQPPESGSPTRSPKRSTSSGTLSSLKVKAVALAERGQLVRVRLDRAAHVRELPEEVLETGRAR